MRFSGRDHLRSLARAGGAILTAVILIAVVLAAAAGGGCGQNPREDRAVADASSRPVPGGTAVIALSSDPGVLNPLLYDAAIAGLVYAEMHDGLTEMDENLAWQPRIATGWQVDPDGMALTYFLRPWRWSDGLPLTARDVVASFALFKDPAVASPRRGFYKDVLRASAPDSATVRYEFARPLPDPVQRTWHHILPWHKVKDLEPAAVGSWPLNAAPLSSGEFMLAEQAHNRYVTLVRNPLYPGTPALLERVVLQVIPQESVQVMALEVGEVDLVDRMPPAAARRLAAGDKVRIVSTGGRRFYYLQWNLRNPRFADALTRRALSLAIDRSRLIDTLVLGYGQAAGGPIPPAVWNHHPRLAAPPHDAQLARTLLAEAGWSDPDADGVLERDGLALTFEILTKQGDPVRESGAIILRENLAEVGAKVTCQVLEMAAGLARVNAGRFDAYFGQLNANLYGDPSGYVHSSAVQEFNQGHYANARVDSLLELALGITEREAALPYWWQLQEILAEDPPAAYLFYPDNLVGISNRLHDVRPHLLSPINNLAEWWIAPQDRKFRSE